MNGTQLSKAVFTMCQDGNTLGTTDETEELEVRLEWQLFADDPDGPFLVIKSKGWSIDSPEELKQLLDKCARAIEPFTVKA